jgi:hypothetical protein
LLFNSTPAPPVAEILAWKRYHASTLASVPPMIPQRPDSPIDNWSELPAPLHRHS